MLCVLCGRVVGKECRTMQHSVEIDPRCWCQVFLGQLCQSPIQVHSSAEVNNGYNGEAGRCLPQEIVCRGTEKPDRQHITDQNSAVVFHIVGDLKFKIPLGCMVKESASKESQILSIL